MVQLTLLLHGTTSLNKNVKVIGNLDPCLNIEGHANSVRSAEKLNDGTDYFSIISSPKIRAIQTASIISNILGISNLVIDARLDAFTTAFDGSSFYDLGIQTLNDLFDLANEEEKKLLNNRLADFINSMKRYGDKKILIVTHGLIVTRIINMLVGTFDFDEDFFIVRETPILLDFMSDKIQLTLVRHAPIIWGYEWLSPDSRNIISLWLFDPEVDRDFIENFFDINLILGVKDFDLYCSPAKRAIGTLQEMLKISWITKQFNINDNLREINFSLNNFPTKKLIIEGLKNWSIPSPITRIDSFLNELKQNTVCITHSFLIRFMYHKLNWLSIDDAFNLNIEFMSFHSFNFEIQRWKV